jgi:uncharacterized damage-inducible protein DinB
MTANDALRAQLGRFVDFEEAHAGFDAAVAGLSPALRGKRPAGAPHSPWELLEHIRITQHDILSFCRDEAYVELSWPADYWPASPAPDAPDEWDASIRGMREDLTALQELAADEGVDLFAPIPWGTGQTYLRELLLVQDHNSYHLGQLILTRQLLGAWPAK